MESQQEPSQKVDLEDLFFVYKRKYQQFCDQITPKFRERWAAVAVLFFLLLCRILYK